MKNDDDPPATNSTPIRCQANRGDDTAKMRACAQVCGGGKARDVSDGGALPVNSASELRKRPPSLDASSKGNVMQKAKVSGWMSSHDGHNN